MRYKLDDKVVLRDDMRSILEGGNYKPTEMKHLKKKLHPISTVSVGGYEVDGWYVEHDDIDHEKTAELKKAALDESETNKITGNIYQDMHPAKVRELLSTPKDAIEPPHYNKGKIDLYEAAYLNRPFNEYRAIMEFVAERYIKRDKDNRIEDLDKAIYTLERLKEKELIP